MDENTPNSNPVADSDGKQPPTTGGQPATGSATATAPKTTEPAGSPAIDDSQSAAAVAPPSATPPAPTTPKTGEAAATPQPTATNSNAPNQDTGAVAPPSATPPAPATPKTGEAAATPQPTATNSNAPSQDTGARKDPPSPVKSGDKLAKAKTQKRKPGSQRNASGKRDRAPGRPKILINACQPGEIRVAIVEDGRLKNLMVEREDVSEYRHSIFKGRVTAINESLDAAFVALGLEKDGFLSLADDEERDGQEGGQTQTLPPPEKGDEILVQVVHEHHGGANKGPTLRRNISLAGKYLVLLPRKPGLRRIPGHQSATPEKQRFVKIIGALNIPEEHGLVLRNRAVNAPKELLQAELDGLLEDWQTLTQEAEAVSAPRLMMLDGNLVSRTIRDELRMRHTRVIIDDQRTYRAVRDLVDRLMPEYRECIEYYDDSLPLFDRHKVDQDLRQINQRNISLESGGEIVIDRTEALTAIDVNSRSAGHKHGPEALAMQTNLEAISEIVRQLRLRDIGGLVVVDFIDMESPEARSRLEEAARTALASDMAHTTQTSISTLGLMEISRQRTGTELTQSNKLLCEHCNGLGWVEDDYSLALKLLREVQAAGDKDTRMEIRLQAPFRIANLLNNDMRHALREVEERANVRVSVLANPYLEPPNHKIDRQPWQPDNEDRAPARAVKLEPKTGVDLQPRSAARLRQPKPVVSSGQLQPAEQAADRNSDRRNRGGRPNSGRTAGSKKPAPKKGLLGGLARLFSSGSSTSTSNSPPAPAPTPAKTEETSAERPPKRHRSRPRGRKPRQSRGYGAANPQAASQSNNQGSRGRPRRSQSQHTKAPQGEKTGAPPKDRPPTQ